MVPARYPAAAWEPVSYAGAASLMSNGSLGWIEHVVVGNGDPWGGFEHAPSNNRRFSHLWFAKDGRVKQYQDLRHDSWAQVAGNDSYWSCETEGNPSEPLTSAQLDALAAWHVWSGTADQLAEKPGQRGVGTHQMGGAAWGGHACPGPIRAGQRAEILRRARILRTSGGTVTTLAPQDVQLLWNAGMPVTGENLNAQTVLARAYMNTNALIARVEQLIDQVDQVQADLAAIKAGGGGTTPGQLATGLTAADVRKALADVLHSTTF